MIEQTVAPRVFGALANQYRQQICLAPMEANTQSTADLESANFLGTEDRSDTLDVSQAELYHIHIPKLHELGYIDWDRDTGNITKGSNWHEIAPLLHLIHDHREVLPAGWMDQSW